MKSCSLVNNLTLSHEFDRDDSNKLKSIKKVVAIQFLKLPSRSQKNLRCNNMEMSTTDNFNNEYEFFLFYVYVHVENKTGLCEELDKCCKSLKLYGRVRVSDEGLNGILGGSKTSIEDFDEYLHKVDILAGCHIQTYKSGLVHDKPYETQKFQSLSVKTTKEVVSLDIDHHIPIQDIISKGSGQYLSPTEFHDILQSLDSNSNSSCSSSSSSNINKDHVKIIDIRNQYEVRIGKFEGNHFSAINPETRQFSEISKYFDEHIHEFEGKKVLMYCTGGVRCERASAYLKYKGITDVYHLQGGIHAYQSIYGDQGYFKGKNFVFDPRISISNKDAYEFTHSTTRTTTTPPITTTGTANDNNNNNNNNNTIGSPLNLASNNNNNNNNNNNSSSGKLMEDEMKMHSSMNKLSELSNIQCHKNVVETTTDINASYNNTVTTSTDNNKNINTTIGTSSIISSSALSSSITAEISLPVPLPVADIKGVYGHCLLCQVPFDDYTPQIRCILCRMLILICPTCYYNTRHDSFQSTHSTMTKSIPIAASTLITGDGNNKVKDGNSDNSEKRDKENILICELCYKKNHTINDTKSLSNL